MAITKVSSGLISADASSIDLNIDAGTLYLDVSENRVGIGTTSPSTKLHVYTTAGRDFKVDQGTANKTILSNDYGLTLKAGGGYNLDLDTGNASGTVRFLDNGSETMRIDSSGNLSVGTTSNPDSRKFRVYGISEIDGAGVSLQVYKSSGTKIGSAGQGNYVISGGPSTGFGIQAENDLVFGSNGTTERMRIDSSGRVGIGTSSPSNLLHASGTGSTRLQIDATDNNAAGAGLFMKVLNSGSMVGNATLRVDNVGNMSFFNGTSSDAERMRIDSSGNVGITTAASLRFNGTGDNTHAVGYDSTVDGSFIRGQSGIRVLTGTGSGTERMRIDSSGNLLVGNTTFNNLSTESGILASKSVVMARGALNDHQDACGVLQYLNNATWLRAYGDTAGSGYMVFKTSGGAGSSDTERMRIASNGRTSIGTTSTNAGLHVANADIRCSGAAVANDANSISMSQESSGGAITARGPSGSTRGTIQLSVNADDGGNGRIGLKIDNDGSVDMAYMPSGSASSDVNINLSTNKLFYVSSSQRYKTNITDLSTSTADILSLRPVNYDRVSEELTGEVGLIAEEVYEIIPHLVNLADVDGFDTPQPESVKYSQLSVYLLKAIQEQQTIIDDLKTRIETLENV